MATGADDDEAAEESGGRRRYDGSGRQRDAAERRSRVLDAARELFLEQGFGSTSIDQIAQRAGTSTQTVYASFGNKPGVLRRVIDVAVAGDHEDVMVFDRPEMRAILDDPDLAARVRLIAQAAASAHRRGGELICLVERVAGSDPACGELAADLRAQFRIDATRVIEALGAEHLRADLPREHLVDVAVLLGDARTWYSLVVERGWTDEEYVDWFADALLRNLVERP
jgi:AcrR family transcriptional regulator